MEKISVREISRRSGYSPGTVSKALNCRPGVSDHTMDSICKIAAEMGYQRIEKVKRVVFVLARRNGSIIDESTFHPFVIEGVEREARCHRLPTSFVHLDVSDAKSYCRRVVELCQDTSSAIVLLGTELVEPDFLPFCNSSAKLVVLDSLSDTHSFDAVLIANESSAYSAVSQLIERGHRCIGYLAGAFRIQNFRHRERGYERALVEAGLVADPRARVTLRTTLEAAHDDMRSWLATCPKIPTAFFADNDVLAVGALRALAEIGCNCPDAVSIMGFDDLRIGVFSDPPLTTVHVHKRGIGRVAVQMLMQKIRTPEKFTRSIQVSTEFVERSSVRSL